MWIGLNDIDSEDTLVWKNGEVYMFTSWAESGSANDEATDCVVMNTDFQYENKTCSDTQLKGYLCMKGTISLPQYNYEQFLNQNNRFKSEFTKEIMVDNVNMDYTGEKVGFILTSKIIITTASNCQVL